MHLSEGAGHMRMDLLQKQDHIHHAFLNLSASSAAVKDKTRRHRLPGAISPFFCVARIRLAQLAVLRQLKPADNAIAQKDSTIATDSKEPSTCQHYFSVLAVVL